MAGGGKRSPQPKAEVTSSKGSNTQDNSEDRSNKNDLQVRGNLGAGMEPAASDRRKMGSLKTASKRSSEKEGGSSWGGGQKKQWNKVPSPMTTTTTPIATKGVSSNSTSSSSGTTDGKPTQSHNNRGKPTSNKQALTTAMGGHRSNPTPSEYHHWHDQSPPTGSTQQTRESWNRSIYADATSSGNAQT